MANDGGARLNQATGRILPKPHSMRRVETQSARDRCDRIDGASFPPGDFVAGAMVVTVTGPAQRHREFIADLTPHCAGLGWIVGALRL